jgi:DnaK suppressor protein
MAKKKPPIDEAEARTLLKRERERIEGSLADAARMRRSEEAEVDTATAPEDDAEVIEDEQVDDALVAQLRAELEALARAEKRLEDGTYGFSVESGEPIPAERLKTVPWAERTAEEQERYERGAGAGP